MSKRPHGKHVFIDTDNPMALGICDVTGFVFPRSEMVKQFQWRGNALVWTGLYVGQPYASVPNETLRPPISIPDPVAVKDPRLQQPSTINLGLGPPLFPPEAPFFSPDGTTALPSNYPNSQRLEALENTGYVAPLPQSGGSGLSINQTLPAIQNIGFITSG